MNKMELSERTKDCRKRKWIYTLLHFLCLFGPLLYFIPYAFITGETVQKIAISFTVIVSIILCIISIVISSIHRAGIHRTIVWLLIAGVLFCLTEIKTFIWVMCITSILDELVFVKLKDKYAELTRTNKEIDRRNG